MGMPVERHRHTVEYYFLLEEKSVDKHEFHDGEILAMSGGTYDHSIVISNVVREIGNRLKGTPCRVAEGNLRVRAGAARRYLYPDASLVCGKPEFDPLDMKRTTIVNPRAVIEVLSGSTEAYDRGDKFKHYRGIASLAEYILVSQRTPAIEVFTREPDGSWRFESFVGLDATARLRSVQIDVPLADIYYGIEFPETDPGPTAELPPTPE